MTLHVLENRNVEMTVLSGDDHFWQTMRKLNKTGAWSVRDVYDLSNCRRNAIHTFVRRLELAGIVKVCGEREGRRGLTQKLYHIVIDQHYTPRVSVEGKILPEEAYKTMWRTIVCVKEFDLDELLALSTNDEPIKRSNAWLYLNRLVKVGILTQFGAKQKPRYRLRKQLGPAAPQIVKGEMVFDPNSREPVGTLQFEVAI